MLARIGAGFAVEALMQTGPAQLLRQRPPFGEMRLDQCLLLIPVTFPGGVCGDLAVA
ncbi:MAG: hypothetical protein AAFU49_17550 [Pseudomonadota bacterium]